MWAVEAPFDLVVSTNGGYPLDRNLYQAVKGNRAAERIVRPGGIIIMAAACEDGVPADGALRAFWPGRVRRPIWPAPLARPKSTAGRPRCSGALARAEVICTRTASTDTRSPVGCWAAPDLDRAVTTALERLGSGARVAVMPQGPLTVATVRPHD